MWSLQSNILGFGNRTEVSEASSSEIDATRFLHGGNTFIWRSEWADATSVAFDGATSQSQSVSDIAANGSTVTSMIDRIISFSLQAQLNVPVRQMYQWGGGKTMDRANRGRYNLTCNLQVETDGNAWTNHLEQGDTLSLQIQSYEQDAANEIGSSGFYYGFSLVLPRLQVLTVGPGGGQDTQVQNITMEVMDDVESSLYRGYYLDIYNNETSYAA